MDKKALEYQDETKKKEKVPRQRDPRMQITHESSLKIYHCMCLFSSIKEDNHGDNQRQYKKQLLTSL